MQAGSCGPFSPRGSHLDSQPTGGKFDGAYGVLAGFEVLEAMQHTGVTTRRPVELVCWSNEEGSRFQPGCMGSSVFTGKRQPSEFLPDTDKDGITVRQHAARLGLQHMDILSGAGHDAMYMATVCPSGMIFIPCTKGISHNETENTRPEEVAAGARVLAACVVDLANR